MSSEQITVTVQGPSTNATITSGTTINVTLGDVGPISWTAVQGKPTTFPPQAHSHAIGDVTGLTAALAQKVELDPYGKVLASQLPSYVDDVLEYANAAALPVTGETGKIYVTLDNGKIFRWSGSTYIEISAAPGSTDVVPEGTSNLYFTTGRAADAALSAVTWTTLTDKPAAFAPSAHAASHAAGGSDPVSVVQQFTFLTGSAPASATANGTNGSYWDWSIPATARTVQIEIAGGGGGGGSGRRGAAGTARSGGSGGSGGSRSVSTLLVSDLTTRDLTIYVGRGGAGGAAVTADNTNGNNSSAASTATRTVIWYRQPAYPSTAVLLSAGGGAAGNGGGTTAAAGVTGESGTFQGSSSGASSITGWASTGGEAAAASSGGGGGGGISAANLQYGGGNGGRISAFSPTAFGGAGSSVAGGNGDNAPASIIVFAGQGGGGGAGNASGAGGNGGNGAFPGGGGGGGGASVNGYNSGAGGNGGDGYVRITVWY